MNKLIQVCHVVNTYKIFQNYKIRRQSNNEKQVTYSVYSLINSSVDCVLIETVGQC